MASPASSKRTPSSAGTTVAGFCATTVAGFGATKVAGFGATTVGAGGGIAGKTVLAATVAGLPVVNLSAGAEINKPSKFVIVL